MPTCCIGNSDEFSKIFESMSGQRDSVVQMEDMTSVSLEAFLKYVYSRDTAGIEKDAKVAAELLRAADKFGIPGLAEICERVILNTRPEKMSVSCALDAFVSGSLLNNRSIASHGVEALQT